MSTRVLVAYGSKYGSTAQIAEKIGQVLVDKGIEAEVVPADHAGDPGGYAAVVVGSGVYYGRWRKPAAKFLKKNEEVLSERPVWLFSSGPTGEGDPVELAQGWHSPKALQPSIDRIKPRDIVLFHGMIDLENLNSLEKTAIKKVEAPSGDFRILGVGFRTPAWVAAVVCIAGTFTLRVVTVHFDIRTHPVHQHDQGLQDHREADARRRSRY